MRQNLKTVRSIRVRGEFEGQHCWPTAPAEVAFLRTLHAHIFKVEVMILVDHSDRDVEFFIARRHLAEVLDQLKSFLVDQPTLSCEAMAEMIGASMKDHNYEVAVVVVSEDGQSDGLCMWVEQVPPK